MCDRHRIEERPLSRRRLMAGAAASAAVFAAGCTTPNAETGRNQIILIDESQLQQAALQAWAQQRSQTRVWNNPTAQARLTRVAQRIVTAAGRGNQQWEFVLFDSPDKNAFVLPANKVGFYRGLMEICERDDWIATVLGHETGHVTGRHAAERYSQVMLANVGMQIAGATIDSRVAVQALGIGAQLGTLGFSREQEAEADILGLNYAHAAGYDVKQAIPFWARMEQGGGSRPPELLSTHPDPANRIAHIRDYINRQGWGPV